MSTTAALTVPDHIHRLANTAHVAGWGCEVMPDWLDDVAAALVHAAGELQARAEQARLDALIGATR